MGVVRTRLSFGSVIVAIVAGIAWFDLNVLPYVTTGAILMVMALGAQAEFYRMLRGARLDPAIGLGMLAGAYYLFTRIAPALEWTYLGQPGAPDPQATFDAGAHLAAATVFLLVVGVLQRRPQGAPQRIGSTLIGVLIVPFLLGYAIEIRYLEEGWAWLIFLIAVAKTGDSTAFFAGKFLGRHKLIPEVSPNKTWEGAIGSMLGSLLVGWLVAATAFDEPLSFSLWFPAAVVVNLGTQFGDLGESLLKRGCETKDSAALLPAFGGLFDMVDSFLVAAPALRLFLAMAGN